MNSANTMQPIFRAMLSIVPVAAFFYLYKNHLNGVLFFDEWTYLVNLQAAPNPLEFVTTPVSGHFTPTHLGLFYVLQHLFGTWMPAFKIVSLILYVATAFLLRAVLRQALPKTSLTPQFVFALFLMNGAFSEIVSWSAHYREQLFVVGLLGWMLSSQSALKSPQKTSPLVGAALSFAVLCHSMSNAILGIGLAALYLALAVFPDWRRLIRTRLFLVYIVLSAVFFGFFWFELRHTLSAQVRAESPQASLTSVGYLISAILSSLEFLGRGLVFPFLNVAKRETHSAWAFIGAFAWLAAVSSHSLVAKKASSDAKRLAQFCILVTLLLVFAQNWYRPGLQFTLEWNKYSYIPGIGFLLASAVTLEAVHVSIKHGVYLILIALNTYAAAKNVPSDYEVFTRHPQVTALIKDFRDTFERRTTTPPLLFNSRFDWGNFPPGVTPRLSNLFRLSTATRHQEVQFFDETSPDFKALSANFKSVLAHDDGLRKFYLKYRALVSLAEKDSDKDVTPPLQTNSFFVIELGPLAAKMSNLLKIEAQAGTFARVNNNTIVAQIVNIKGEELANFKTAASTIADNRFFTLWAGDISLETATPLYLAVFSPDASHESTEVFYRQTKPELFSSYRACKGSLAPHTLAKCLENGDIVHGNFALRIEGSTRPSF